MGLLLDLRRRAEICEVLEEELVLYDDVRLRG